ncbi:MAG: AbrB/MazE/SpoVT family DNA-binding domain-containing protein [Nanoarchaeota archaeon]|nr:AbrB/MazE/SpoVT family DNA-binding domain-containing protein [Nanoarchaeota archaeon]MBU4117036.1 AbrB/MazE/SpoVT family DNA-binding domain-containing protein [Nanoarchaeota archaeon]
MNMDIIKISSKGQIVIPSRMRGDLKEGEELIIIKDDERIILKKIGKLTESIKEDLEFARRTEEAFQRIEAGEFISVDSDNLFEEMDKW